MQDRPRAGRRRPSSQVGARAPPRKIGTDQRDAVHGQRPVARAAGPPPRCRAGRWSGRPRPPVQLARRPRSLGRSRPGRRAARRARGARSCIPAPPGARVDLDGAAPAVGVEELAEHHLGRHVGRQHHAGAPRPEHLGQRDPPLRLRRSRARAPARPRRPGIVARPPTTPVTAPAWPGRAPSPSTTPVTGVRPAVDGVLDQRRGEARAGSPGPWSPSSPITWCAATLPSSQAGLGSRPVALQVPLVGRRGHDRLHRPVAEPLRAELLGDLGGAWRSSPARAVERRAGQPVRPLARKPAARPEAAAPRPRAVHDRRARAAAGEEVRRRGADRPSPRRSRFAPAPLTDSSLPAVGGQRRRSVRSRARWPHPSETTSPPYSSHGSCTVLILDAPGIDGRPRQDRRRRPALLATARLQPPFARQRPSCLTSHQAARSRLASRRSRRTPTAAPVDSAADPAALGSTALAAGRIPARRSATSTWSPERSSGAAFSRREGLRSVAPPARKSPARRRAPVRS